MDLAMLRTAKVNELSNIASASSSQPLHLDIASSHEAYLGAPYIRFNVFFCIMHVTSEIRVGQSEPLKRRKYGNLKSKCGGASGVFRRTNCFTNEVLITSVTSVLATDTVRNVFDRSVWALW